MLCVHTVSCSTGLAREGDYPVTQLMSETCVRAIWLLYQCAFHWAMGSHATLVRPVSAIIVVFTKLMES